MILQLLREPKNQQMKECFLFSLRSCLRIIATWGNVVFALRVAEVVGSDI